MRKWMIFLVGLLMLGVTLGCTKKKVEEKPVTKEEAVAAMVTDPVCGMKIEAEKAFKTVEYQGHKYYLCSEDCATMFEEDPGKYAAKGEVPMPEGMHQM